MTTSIALRRTFPSLISSIAEVDAVVSRQRHVTGNSSSRSYGDSIRKGGSEIPGVRYASQVANRFIGDFAFECLDDSICRVKLERLLRIHTG
jgi:hypothetical protein